MPSNLNPIACQEPFPPGLAGSTLPNFNGTTHLRPQDEAHQLHPLRQYTFSRRTFLVMRGSEFRHGGARAITNCTGWSNCSVCKRVTEGLEKTSKTSVLLRFHEQKQRVHFAFCMKWLSRTRTASCACFSAHNPHIPHAFKSIFLSKTRDG